MTVIEVAVLDLDCTMTMLTSISSWGGATKLLILIPRKQDKTTSMLDAALGA